MNILASFSEITDWLVRKRLVQALESVYSSYPGSPEASGCPRVRLAQLALCSSRSSKPYLHHVLLDITAQIQLGTGEGGPTQKLLFWGVLKKKISTALFLLFTALEIKVVRRK